MLLKAHIRSTNFKFSQTYHPLAGKQTVDFIQPSYNINFNYSECTVQAL